MPAAAWSAPDAEPAASTLPEAPWHDEAVMPRAPSSAPAAEPGVPTLPEAPWDQATPSSPPSSTSISSDAPGLTGGGASSNGAGRHGQQAVQYFASENGATPEESGKPAPRESDSPAVEGSWGDLPTEAEADDPIGYGGVKSQALLESALGRQHAGFGGAQQTGFGAQTGAGAGQQTGFGAAQQAGFGAAQQAGFGAGQQTGAGAGAQADSQQSS